MKHVFFYFIELVLFHKRLFYSIRLDVFYIFLSDLSYNFEK